MLTVRTAVRCGGMWRDFWERRRIVVDIVFVTVAFGVLASFGSE